MRVAAQCGHLRSVTLAMPSASFPPFVGGSPGRFLCFRNIELAAGNGVSLAVYFLIQRRDSGIHVIWSSWPCPARIVSGDRIKVAAPSWYRTGRKFGNGSDTIFDTNSGRCDTGIADKWCICRYDVRCELLAGFARVIRNRCDFAVHTAFPVPHNRPLCHLSKTI